MSSGRAAQPVSLGRLCAALGGLFLALAIAPSAASATALPEKITENTTLTAAGNPYTGSTTIESGVTLDVEPGLLA